MKISFLSLFPSMFAGSLKESILDRASKAGIFSYEVVNPRDFSQVPHFKVDDYPYGGGPGMLLEPRPLYEAHGSILKSSLPDKKVCTLLMTTTGKRFTQADAIRLSKMDHLIFICGHYEGLDERISELADEIFSLGDYVLTGGELPALVMTDGIVRNLEGTLGHEDGAEKESFSDSLLEYPQYTRPPLFEGKEVPPVLLSGHHEEIEKWRRKQSLLRTIQRRPDLLMKAELTDKDLKLLSMDPKKWEEK